MSESNYQQMFRDYLRSKGFTRKSIAIRERVFAQYQQWVEAENLELEEISYQDLLLFQKYSRQKGRTQRL